MGMQQYMGYISENAKERSPRTLPEVDFAGTIFQVDIDKGEFIETKNPYNRIPFYNVREEYGFSILLFDTQTKNRYIETDRGCLPDHVSMLILPPLKELDPVGLARLYGFDDGYYHSTRESDQPKKVIELQKQNNQFIRKGKKGLSI